MEHKAIDEMLEFSIPDEMREMTEEEYVKYFPCNREQNYGFRNEEKHTIIAIGAKKRPILIGRAATLDAELRASEKKLKRKASEYENLGYFERTIDGKKVPAFRFSYKVQGIKQTAEYCLYRTPKYFCAFEYLCGEAYDDFAKEKFEEFLSAIRFK